LAHSLSLAFLIAIFESASWSSDQILAFSSGLSSDQKCQPAAKKRLSSKSKKRQQELLQSNATDNKRNEAEAEWHHRGDIACSTALFIWPELEPIVQDGSPEAITCICACANSCLAHWAQNYENMTSQSVQHLIQSIMLKFQEICSHHNRSVRGLTYEPIMALNEALQREESPIESIIVDHLFHCSMRLAVTCHYPKEYFEHMGQESDQDLEIERNDVRNVLRAVCGGEDAYSGPPNQSSIQILNKLLHSIFQSILGQTDEHGLPHESAVHALSSLAKPLNVLAKAIDRDEVDSYEPLNMACRAYSHVAAVLEKLLAKLEISKTFAVS
jgi:hypothetical protein